MTTPSPRKSTAASRNADKAAALTLATEVLANRVSTLADAVLINNSKIDKLQQEVNTKPDDTEVKFITGLAQAERARHLRFAIGTGLIASILAGGVAYSVADQQGSERCMVNAQNIRTIVALLESFPDPEGRLVGTIDDLKSNRNEC